MKPSYKGFFRPFLLTLSIPEDAESVRPVLEHLDGLGRRLCSMENACSRKIVDRASAVVAFLSPGAVRDSAFVETLTYAAAAGKPVVAVYLEETELPPSLAVYLNSMQGLFRSRFSDDAAFYAKLDAAAPIRKATLAPVQKRVLGAFALALLLLAAGVVFALWPRTESVAVETEAVATAVPDPVLAEMFAGFTQSDLNSITSLKLVGDTRFEDGEEVSEEWDNGACNWYYKGEKVEKGTLTDLSILAEMDNLTEVVLKNQSITDISVLFTLPRLQRLEIDGCDITSLEGIENTKVLNELGLRLTKVSDLSPLRNWNTPGRRRLSLVHNPIEDYSPLRDIPSFYELHINNDRYTSDGNYGRMSEIVQYLEGKNITELSLYGCDRAFTFDSLTSISPLNMLELQSDEMVTLDGVEALADKVLQLRMDAWQLRDISALSAMTHVTTLQLASMESLQDATPIYDLPLSDLELNYPGDALTLDFDRLQGVKKLTLEGVRTFTNLAELEKLPQLTELQIYMMPWITDYSPLEKLRVFSMAVSPNMEETAKKLLDEGTIQEMRVSYRNWTEEGIAQAMAITPVSLEQLQALSDADLPYVECFGMIGDRFFNPWQQNLDDDWENDKLVYELDGERIDLQPGTVTDLSWIQKMTGLKELRLVEQPIDSLDGIQNMTQLQSLQLRSCKVSDLSPAFAVPTIQDLSAFECPVTTLQGVQNLFAPRSIDCNGCGITDIQALAECDFSAAYADEGVSLGLNQSQCADYSALGTIEKYRWLGLADTDASLWLPVLTGIPIGQLEARHCGITDEDLPAVAALNVAELEIKHNDELTDLSPLLQSESLQTLRVSKNMEKMAEKIRGEAKFEIRVED